MQSTQVVADPVQLPQGEVQAVQTAPLTKVPTGHEEKH